MTRGRPFACAGAFSLLIHAGAPAQDVSAARPATITLRATRPELPAELVRYVARNAEGRRLDRAGYPRAGEFGARRVFRTLCGRTLPAYEQSFRARNGLAPDANLDAPMGDAAYGYVWPACLYVSESPAVAVVDPGESVGSLFLAQTGRMGARDEMRRFYGLRDIDRVAPGRTLTGHFATAAVHLTPQVDTALFSTGVQTSAKSFDGFSSAATREITPADDADLGGEIMLAETDDDSAAVYSAPPDCPSSPPAPFEVARLSKALATLQGLVRNNSVSVWVLDNGFDAARRENGAIRFEPRFPARMFERPNLPDGTPGIGPRIEISASEPPLDALTIPPAGVPPYVSGHGTHVAGTIIGSATLDGTSVFDLPDDDSWLRLTIVPLSAGRREVSRIALREATSQLDLARASVANLSVRYDSDVSTNLREAIRRNPGTLFVAAAGNDGQNVVATKVGSRSVFPAMLGGKTTNVISVAAEDGSGFLTRFTNRSAEHVDIAAPGCSIASWVSGERIERLSGTSQAAPLVTFTASLLARYRLDASRIKRRILLSGDILAGRRVAQDAVFASVPTGDGEDVPIYSRSRLDVVKAMLFRRDYLRVSLGTEGSVDDPRRTVELLGFLHTQGDLRCGGEDVDSRLVLALKRGASDLWCFPNGTLRPVRVQDGGTPEIDFTVETIFSDGGHPAIAPPPWTTITVKTTDLQEFIRSDPAMSAIEGGL